MAASQTKSTSKPRRSQLKFRMTTRHMDLIERAAAYEGKPPARFVVDALVAAAKKAVYEYEVVYLNAMRNRKFVESLQRSAPDSICQKKTGRKQR